MQPWSRLERWNPLESCCCKSTFEGWRIYCLIWMMKAVKSKQNHTSTRVLCACIGEFPFMLFVLSDGATLFREDVLPTSLGQFTDPHPVISGKPSQMHWEVWFPNVLHISQPTEVETEINHHTDTFEPKSSWDWSYYFSQVCSPSQQSHYFLTSPLACRWNKVFFYRMSYILDLSGFVLLVSYCCPLFDKLEGQSTILIKFQLKLLCRNIPCCFATSGCVTVWILWLTSNFKWWLVLV